MNRAVRLLAVLLVISGACASVHAQQKKPNILVIFGADIGYWNAGAWERWRVEHAFVLVPAQAYVAEHLSTYRDFPPRQ